MGSAYGETSPVKTFAKTLYVEAQLDAGQRLTLPHAEERAVYVADGRIAIDDDELTAYNMGILTNKNAGSVTALEPARIAIIGGESMPHRHMYWNFVSSRRERIEQAKQDWAAQRFAKVPGDEEEFIPLPD